ncbi:MAG: LPS assembly lipoprotein LptE [Marinicella sp.]
MKNVLLFIPCLVLTACGYHLKSAVQLDEAYNKTFIQYPVNTPLYRPLVAALSNQGIQLMESAPDATAKLIIIKDDLKKQVQSIGTNNRVQEYRLEYDLTFTVHFTDRVAIKEKTLSLSRDYAFDIGQISGAQAEEQVLRQQLYQDMAQMIIRTIANHK